MLQRIFHSKTKTVSFAAFLIGGSTLLSRFLGILRNNLLGNIFPPEKVDIYLASFRLPDLVYGILITGGITAAFLPVFAEHFHKNKKEAEVLSRNVFTIFVLGLGLLSLILFIFSPYLVKLIVPGFSPAQQQETLHLMRIMFLSPIILGASAIVSSVLQYFDLFFSYSLAPIFYNLGILTGILFFSKKFGMAGLAWGVVLGAVLHFLIQLPAFLKTGFSLKPFLNLSHKGLRRIFKLMIPRTIGSGAYYLNLLITTAIASTLATGSIMVFNFANDIYGVPMGLIGISFATAAFPALSRNFAQRQDKKFFESFASAFSKIIFFAVPLSCLMFLFRAQVVRLLYGTKLLGQGYFSWDLTRLTAASVGVLSVSIFASCLIPLLARVFYSFHDTKTPVKISVFAIILNIVLSLWFCSFLQQSGYLQDGLFKFLKLHNLTSVRVLGLSIALAISTIIQFLLLILFLKKRANGAIIFRKACPDFLKIIAASLGMSGVAFFALRFFALFFDTATVFGLLLQVVCAGMAGVATYGLLCWRLKCFKPKKAWLCLKNNLTD